MGAFRPEGATVLAETWGAVDFYDQQGFEESEQLTKEMLQRLDEKKLIEPTLTDKDVRMLYGAWQFPMYNLDLRPVKAGRDELDRERERLVPYDY